ncbi:MAG: ECF-type sigma factor [Ginsengibacter sp.]
MANAAGDDLTELLHRVRAGDAEAELRIIELLYRDLRAVAAGHMRREKPGHTWQTTVLVDEALLRLGADGTLAAASDKSFLLRAASRAMRQLLIDHHRHRNARVRGGRHRKHPLDLALDHLADVDGLPLVELRDEIDRLVQVDGRAGMVVQLRFFSDSIGLQVRDF